MRLPFKQVVALTSLIGAAVTGSAIATGNPASALWGAAGGLICYASFMGFAMATKGGIGNRDVTLTAPLGLVTASTGGLPLTWWWLMASLTATAIYGLARRKTGHHPLGPWLIIGAVGALTASV